MDESFSKSTDYKKKTLPTSRSERLARCSDTRNSRPTYNFSFGYSRAQRYFRRITVFNRKRKAKVYPNIFHTYSIISLTNLYRFRETNFPEYVSVNLKRLFLKTFSSLCLFLITSETYLILKWKTKPHLLVIFVYLGNRVARRDTSYVFKHKHM